MFLALARTSYGQQQGEPPSTAPSPGAVQWGAGDERGNGNTQGVDTRMRCAFYLAQPAARVYEDVMIHYKKFFAIVTDLSSTGTPPSI